MNNIDFNKIVAIADYRDSLSDNREDFDKMLTDAQSEMNFYNWCLEIQESYVGIFYTGVVGVFLFKIKPSSDVIDEWVWVIVGDVPPIYITSEESPNAACALESYIGAMNEWVDAAENGRSVADLVPVNVPANRKNAQALKIRLVMLNERVLSLYKDDLKA